MAATPTNAAPAAATNPQQPVPANSIFAASAATDHVRWGTGTALAPVLALVGSAATDWRWCVSCDV